MNRYEKFKSYVEDLKITSNKMLNGFDEKKILYCDIWNMIDLNTWGIIKRVIAQIFFNPLHYTFEEDSIADSIRLAVEIKIGDLERKDNRTIFNNLYFYYGPCQHLKIYKKYIFAPLQSFRKCILIIKNAKHIKGISVIKRVYLGTQLAMMEVFLDNLKKDINPEHLKSMLIFQEHDTISSTIIQYVHQYGVKVISPQHALPMNRCIDLEQLIFDGFVCDYKLLWSEFSRRQFLEAGIEESKLRVVGNTKLLNEENDKSACVVSENVGIMFDCPQNSSAKESNIKLLELGNMLAKEYDKKILVKLHPIDKAESYKGYYDENAVTILDKSTSMKEFENNVEFAIAHITGAIADFIYDGRPVFVFKYKDSYPIETDDIYIFRSINEFKEHYTLWNNNRNHYKNEYKKIQNIYYTSNSKQLHELFFKELKENGM